MLSEPSTDYSPSPDPGTVVLTPEPAAAQKVTAVDISDDGAALHPPPHNDAVRAEEQTETAVMTTTDVSPRNVDDNFLVPGATAGDNAVQARSAGPAPSESTISHSQKAPPPSFRADKAEAAESATVTDEIERDNKGSVSTTLTTSHNQTPFQMRSSKRKAHNLSSSSEGPSEKRPATPEGSGKQKIPNVTKKRSFLSKLVRKFVPCLRPSRAHPAEAVTLDEGVSTLEPKPKETTQGEKQNEADNAKLDANGAAREPIATPSLPTPKDEAPAKDAQQTADSQTVLSPFTVPPVIIPLATTEDHDAIAPPATKQGIPPAHPPPEDLKGITSGGVQPPGSTGDPHSHTLGLTARDDDSDVTTYTDEEDGAVEDVEDDDERLLMNGGVGIPIGPDGVPRPLLPPIAPHHVGRKCLVLDLDETLVHSSFKSIQQADYVVPVEIEYHWHNVYVIKRPGVDNFLKRMGEIYEVVVFTASLSKYADPVLDKLDVHHVVSHRLFRESCYNHKGNYVKDLSQLGRPMTDTIILDNSPASYIFHPNNAVPVSSWFNDPHDTELTDLCPFLTDLSPVDDVRGVLDGGL